MIKEIGSERFYRLLFLSVGIGFIPWVLPFSWRPTWYLPWFLALGVWASIGNLLLHALQYLLLFPPAVAKDPSELNSLRSFAILFLLLKGFGGVILFYSAWLYGSSSGILQVLAGFLFHIFSFAFLMLWATRRS